MNLSAYRKLGLGVLALAALMMLPALSIAADLVNTAAQVARPVTFARDIAPILQEKCQECHHSGSMAPRSLVTYEETRPWAKAIKQAVLVNPVLKRQPVVWAGDR